MKNELEHLANRIVDYFAHASLRGDPDTYRRARLLIASLAFFPLIQLVTLLVILLASFSELSKLLASAIILPTSIWFGHVLFQLRRHGNYLRAAYNGLALLLTMMILGVAVSGGPASSPVSQLLVIPPLAAYFFGGRKLGARFVGVTALLLFVSALLQLLGFPFPQTVQTDSQLRILSLVLSFMNLSVISVMAFIYEFTAAQLRMERDLEHQKFVELAKTDPLTGLANRRNFDSVLSERISMYGQQQPPQRFALGYLDLDGFKPINDQYGHAVGDEVLCVISERLRNTLRGADFVGRHGGDEFMLLLDLIGSQTSLETMAERLLHIIAQPIQTSAGIVGVTGSLGFAMYPLDADEIEALKKSADSAMYEAKHQRGTWRSYQR